MDITVYTWKFNADLLGSRELWRSADSGHAAILINDNGKYHYFSWWPNQNRLQKPELNHTIITKYSQDEMKMRFAPDAKHHAEGKYQFSRSKIDCNKVSSYLQDVRTGNITTSRFAENGKYQSGLQNCSSVIAWALRRGGGDNYLPWPGYLVWHPNNLALYCEKLVGAIGFPGARCVRNMSTASREPSLFTLIKKSYFN